MNTTELRTILGKRQCKHDCGNEIYLQYVPVTPTLRWIAFDMDGRLHSCPNKPLDFVTMKLIQDAMDRMKPTSTINNIHTNINNIEVLHRIDLMIEDLEVIRQYLANDLG